MAKRVVTCQLTLTRQKKFAFGNVNIDPAVEAADLQEMLWDALGSPDPEVLTIVVENVQINLEE
jgi:hypothetical protein